MITIDTELTNKMGSNERSMFEKRTSKLKQIFSFQIKKPGLQRCIIKNLQKKQYLEALWKQGNDAKGMKIEKEKAE